MLGSVIGRSIQNYRAGVILPQGRETMSNTKFTAAVVQASPVMFDKAACITKAAALIAEAGRRGARLAVFPESFIPCYPRGLSFGMHVGGADGGGRQDYLLYHRNSVVIPRDLAPLCEAAKQAGCYVSIGVTERDERTDTLYCTNVFISDKGEIVGKKRKLKPTGAERCVWGEGGRDDLFVLDTPVGRLGCLICWENYMPLARTALYEQGVNVYIAPTADSRKEWQATVRHIAQEGRCFVLSCNQYVTRDMYPEGLCSVDKELFDEVCPGGSCIISPTGKYLAQPVYHKEEMLLATIDLSAVSAARLDFDPCGHYSRPDLFELKMK